MENWIACSPNLETDRQDSCWSKLAPSDEKRRKTGSVQEPDTHEQRVRLVSVTEESNFERRIICVSSDEEKENAASGPTPSIPELDNIMLVRSPAKPSADESTDCVERSKRYWTNLFHPVARKTWKN